jgi:hypothetical protein
MNILNKIKGWWKKRNVEQDAKVTVHFKLPSGRTFDIEAIDPNKLKKK